jgi:hypothetical protein
MWDLNFGTWISHRGFTVAFDHGHPLVIIIIIRKGEEKWKTKMCLKVLFKSVLNSLNLGT